MRQFLSGLTNQRDDEWGHDRLRFAREVIAAVRAARHDGVARAAPVVRRAGAVGRHHARAGAGHRRRARRLPASTTSSSCAASIYSVEKTRPDFHEPTGFNIDVCRAVSAARARRRRSFLQGSVVDGGQAEWAVGDDGVVRRRWR